MSMYLYGAIVLYAIHHHPQHCAQYLMQSLHQGWQRSNLAVRYALLLLPILATAIATTAEQALGLALILATTLRWRR